MSAKSIGTLPQKEQERRAQLRAEQYVANRGTTEILTSMRSFNQLRKLGEQQVFGTSRAYFEAYGLAFARAWTKRFEELTRSQPITAADNPPEPPKPGTFKRIKL